MVETRSESSSPDAFVETIAAEIREHAQILAGRWLDRLLSLIPVGPNEVFPTESILDHVPTLIDQIAIGLAAPDHEIAANSFVVSKARELGELRYEQNASVHQLLREYELLRSILETFVMERALSLQLRPDLPSVFGCVRRLNQTVVVLTQTTVDTFVRRYAATIAQQQQRLEQFNRMVGHELRQPLSALQAAVDLLRLDTDAAGDKALAVIRRNVGRLSELTRTISRLSGMIGAEERQPTIQRVSLTTFSREVARQLRETADARGVAVRVGEHLGDITVDVGQLQLILVNLLSNGIKYADRTKAERFVAIDAVSRTDSQCVFCVRDNGIGMDATQLAQVFAPFYRGHADRDHELGADGFGLGMTIVRDCLASLNGRVDVESTPGAGTTFTVTLPTLSALNR
ncbi:MAG TPA: HAMP domain-containing sensor histidine kinase [Vicinamibacterales bacterium]|nr:HAMP domain-containing sensor histidine kinase [Vicinamibacterales bacterium]